MSDLPILADDGLTHCVAVIVTPEWTRVFVDGLEQ
jgi:hypothetical protein